MMLPPRPETDEINKKFLRGSRGQFFQKAPPGRRRQIVNYGVRYFIFLAWQWVQVIFGVSRV
jgi:hypothetical protein